MSALTRLRNFWMLWVTTIVLACFSSAVARVSYKVTDLGTLAKDNLGCAMSLNNEGWTEIMAGYFEPGTQDSVPAYPLSGRAVMGIDGYKIDLGTLGGQNTWMMWGQINDRAQIVGYSETSVPDPNGEDVCGFGTHVICRPFLWEFFHMRALQTLGGNNGQASGINNRGQIAGFAENGEVDSTCPPGATNNRIDLGAFWKNAEAKPQVLSPVGSDPDSIAYGINEHGQAVGYSGSCIAVNHAVVWNNRTPTPLQDLGSGAIAYGINNQGQIVGAVGDGTTQYGALWQNGVLTNFNNLPPGDIGGLASGINNKGQVVGSNFDSYFNWSDGFIYENGVMTDLNTLIPAGSNLYVTMANKINERGQISGMAIVHSGPHEGDIHAILLTPVNESIGKSMADVARTDQKVTLPANVGKQILRRSGLGRLGQ